MSDTTPPTLGGGEEAATTRPDNDGCAAEREHAPDVDDDEPNH